MHTRGLAVTTGSPLVIGVRQRRLENETWPPLKSINSELCMSRLLNNQPRRISIYRLQRRLCFGFKSSVSSTPMTSGDPVVTAEPLVWLVKQLLIGWLINISPFFRISIRQTIVTTPLATVWLALVIYLENISYYIYGCHRGMADSATLYVSWNRDNCCISTTNCIWKGL